MAHPHPAPAAPSREAPSPVQLVGRTSSLFTRVPRIFAHVLHVPLELVPVPDLTAVDTGAYGDNPALKHPTLRRGGSQVFGTENICRALADLASPGRRIVWPEALRSDVSRNAQELVWHAMAAQVQLVFGTVVNGLPADNLYFAKGRAGFEGALRWLDAHWDEAEAALPADRDLSLLEVTALCLIEHLGFRGTLPVEPYPRLVRFAHEYGAGEAALATAYAFPPAPPAR